MANAQSEYGIAVNERLEKAIGRIENALNRMASENGELRREIEALRADRDEIQKANGILKERQRDAAEGLDRTIGQLKRFLEE